MNSPKVTLYTGLNLVLLVTKPEFIETLNLNEDYVDDVY